MIGEPRLRGVDVRHEVAYAVLPVEQDADDLEPRLVRQRVEELRGTSKRGSDIGGHGRNVSKKCGESRVGACAARTGGRRCRQRVVPAAAPILMRPLLVSLALLAAVYLALIALAWMAQERVVWQPPRAPTV